MEEERSKADEWEVREDVYGKNQCKGVKRTSKEYGKKWEEGKWSDGDEKEGMKKKKQSEGVIRMGKENGKK